MILTIPTIAFSKQMQNKFLLNAETQKTFKNNFTENGLTGNAIGFQSIRNFNKFKSNISINSSSKNKLTFDQSFIEFNSKNKIFGIGKINRNWSFSPNTSLILSSNARPSDSIYFLMQKNQKPENILSWIGPWSFETFNSFTSNPIGIKNSMLLGIRVVIEPIENLKFEAVKTSQWGGNGQNQNISSLIRAIGGNTNEDEDSNINQMAGIGVSFLTNINKIQSRFYSQLIGEDEAGSLPSCFMSMIGNEFIFPTNGLFSKIGFEFIDTRINKTANGYCGPNTAYNNNLYPYTNYGKVIGTSIDTESKSFNIWASKKISETITINTSFKDITINDNNYLSHRLSSTKKNGLQTNVGISIQLKSLKIRSEIFHQNFTLDKAGYKNNLNFKLSTEYIF
ncbi:capsule assembly Wzi family protein [Amylibacter sp.]|nr:capsule assembly Wzi family protein [Amylibacter sp.]